MDVKSLMFDKAVVSCNAGHHGLGNRIRVVLGAQELADRERRRFGYVWPTGQKFRPKLTDLWEFDAVLVPEFISRALTVRYPYLDNTLSWIEGMRSRRLWQIRTAHALLIPGAFQAWESRLRDLTPSGPIQDKVNRIFHSRLKGVRFVGVMIRAHQLSHGRTLEASPVQWYLDRMRELRSADPELHFYVSCDVPEVQAQVIRSVPQSIGQDDKGAYNSTSGVQDALVDLYLLGSSCYLLGPYYSSFVELAWYLAGREIGLETSERVEIATPHRQVGLVADPLRPAASRLRPDSAVRPR